VISAAGAGDAAFGASTGAITGSGSEASTFGEAGEVSAAGDEGVTSVSLFAGAAADTAAISSAMKALQIVVDE
jgi:hypothetical protein